VPGLLRTCWKLGTLAEIGAVTERARPR
jgi:hypothetical protein